MSNRFIVFADLKCGLVLKNTQIMCKYRVLHIYLPREMLFRKIFFFDEGRNSWHDGAIVTKIAVIVW
jgi:hypothetical protein